MDVAGLRETGTMCPGIREATTSDEATRRMMAVQEAMITWLMPSLLVFPRLQTQ